MALLAGCLQCGDARLQRWLASAELRPEPNWSRERWRVSGEPERIASAQVRSLEITAPPTICNEYMRQGGRGPPPIPSAPLRAIVVLDSGPPASALSEIAIRRLNVLERGQSKSSSASVRTFSSRKIFKKLHIPGLSNDHYAFCACRGRSFIKEDRKLLFAARKMERVYHLAVESAKVGIFGPIRHDLLPPKPAPARLI